MLTQRLPRLFACLLLLPVVSCTTITDPADGDDDDVVGFAGYLERQLFALPGRPFAIRVAPDGTLFVTQQDLGQVTILPDGGDAARDSAAVGNDPGDVVITPNGQTAIISTFIDGDLHFINAATGAESDFTVIGNNAYRLQLSSSGADLFVTTTEGKVYRVTVANGNKADSVTLAGPQQGIARGPGGVIAVASPDGTITLLDPATLDVIDDRNVGGTPQDIVFSADGQRLFVAQEDANQVLVLNAATLASVDSIALDEPVAMRPFGLALSPDDAHLIVTAPQSGGVVVVDVPSLEIARSFLLGGTPRRVTFDALGQRAYIAFEAGLVWVLR